MAHSFSFDGTDLAGSSYGLMVARMPMVWSTAPVLDVQKPLYGFAASQGVAFEPRSIALPCWVEGSSHSDLQAKLDAIVMLLDSELGAKDLKLDWIPGRYWRARLSSPIVPEFAGATVARLQLEFWTGEPGFANAETEQTVEVDADPKSFNVPASGVVAGTHDAYPVWFIKGGGTPTGVVTLANTTTGESITWQGVILPDQWLAIARGWRAASPALQSWSMFLSTGTGADPTALSYAQAISGFSAGGMFPRLKRGVANAMTVSGLGSDAEVQVMYRARYK